VGRVRFATRPREVILFQSSRISGIEIEQEFTNLADVRAHFGLETGSQVERRLQGQAIEQLAQLGATNAQIAAELGICERTIRNRRAAMREGRSA
jgi:FixJ family two-component response regulator